GNRHGQEPQGDYAAYRAQRDTCEDPQGIHDVLVCQEEQPKDEDSGQRDDQQQTARGTLIVLELAAPIKVVAALQFQAVSVDFPLGLGYEAAHIPLPDVAGDDDPPLAPFAGNGGWTFRFLDVSQALQR